MAIRRSVRVAIAAVSGLTVVLMGGVHAASGHTGSDALSSMRQILMERHGIRTPLGAGTVAVHSGQFECVVGPTEAKNVTLDCPNEYGVPTDESSIAVDPSDPNHIVTASLNENWPYMTIQITTSFDGGRTWSVGDLPRRPHTINWDPWLAFDVKRHTVVLAFETDDDFQDPTVCFQDQMVATSSDGGITWGNPVKAVPTRGDWCNAPGAVFEEGKIAIDNDPSSSYFGRMWITALYIECITYSDCRGPIAESHSDDGGVTWTNAQSISGSSDQYCTSPPAAPACDLDAPPNVVTVSPDGSIHVAFLNGQNVAAQESYELAHPLGPDRQLMVVSSTDGGQTWSPPVHVVDLEDGDGDYSCLPAYYFGCRLSGTALGSGLVGGYVVAGPDGTLYVTFSDNRNGHHDVQHPVSNDDVFVMTSHDGGQTWSGPDLVAGRIGDEFNPTIAVNPKTGELGIAFYDRTGDPKGKTMNVTLATGMPGDFELTRVTTAPSHLSHDLWWAQTIPGCSSCVYHIGEYFGLAFGSDGAAHLVWADLRHLLTLPTGRKGYGMNVDYARVDPSGVPRSR